MPFSVPFFRWFCAAVLALTLAAAAPGQISPGTGAGGEADIDALEARRAAAEADTTLPAEVQARVVELFARAIDERGRAATLIAETSALNSRLETAPDRIRALEAEVAGGATEPTPGEYEELTLQALDRRVQDKQQALQSARDELKAAERELVGLTAQGPVMSEEIARRKRALRDLEDDIAQPVPGELPVSADAREVYVLARKARLEAEIAKAEVQLANYEQLVRLATLERDAAVVRVSGLDAEREVLTAALEARRAREAREGRRQAQDTEAATSALPDAVASLAIENAELRRELEEITVQTARVAEQLRGVERRSSALDADLESLQERVATVGSTQAVGRLLWRRLESLGDLEAAPTPAVSRSSEASRVDEIVRATDRRIDLGERRRELAQIEPRVDAILAEVPEEERQRLGDTLLREQASALVAAARDTIDALHEAHGRYLTQLSSYEAAHRQLISTAENMREFIRRELLWTRTLPPIRLSDFAATATVGARLLTPGNWRRALNDVLAGAAAYPWLAAAGLLIVLVLLGFRPWARRRLAELGALTSRIRTDAFRHTLLALGLTIFIAAAWPAVLRYAGALLGAAQDAAPFSRELSYTLLRLSDLIIIFVMLRWVIHYNGLARRHFRWPEAVRVMLRRELQWLTPVAVLCIVLGVFGSAQATAPLFGPGRPALIVFALALAVFFWRLFRRRSSLMQVVFRKHPGSLSARLWRLWFPLLVVLPVLDVLAAAAGYGEAARIAVLLLIDTGSLAVAVVVLRDVLLRWFTVAERRLRFDRALRQREEAQAERSKQAAEGEEAPSSETAEVDVPEIDYRELGEQGRAVVQVAVIVGVVLALARLWSDLLPALDVLDQFQLPLSRVALIDGVEQTVAVSGSDAAMALLVLAATLFAAKNLSGLLGFTLLRRVARDAGAQYAIVTLCQYALVAAGLLYAVSTFGVQWSKLQWLVAALGVGLGFGLQEIVANFVSGIILLLERPVRVGDVVTVGDATGTVSRIRIRATTIVDWDRKELVVPNKEFVTGRLLNWTLSNNVLRLVIGVGVAYGSDVRRARELLQEAARENEYVLDDPAPIVLFNNFGDNALGLELRVYLPSIDHLLAVQTALHDAIYERFEKAGIVISFPQRDVHLDTSGPLDIRVHDASDAATAPRRPWRRPRRT